MSRWSRRGLLLAALAAVPAGSLVLVVISGPPLSDYVPSTIIFSMPAVVALLVSDTRRARLVAGIAAAVLLAPTVLAFIFGAFVYLPAVALLLLAALKRDDEGNELRPERP